MANVESVLDFHKIVVASLTFDFNQGVKEKTLIEGDIQWCSMVLPDHYVLIAQSRHKLEKICLDKALLQLEVDALYLGNFVK